jgi:hypothetical protein
MDAKAEIRRQLEELGTANDGERFEAPHDELSFWQTRR